MNNTPQHTITFSGNILPADVLQQSRMILLVLDQRLSLISCTAGAQTLFFFPDSNYHSYIGTLPNRLTNSLFVEKLNQALKENKTIRTQCQTLTGEHYLLTAEPVTTEAGERNLLLSFTNITETVENTDLIMRSSADLIEALAEIKAGWGHWDWITGECEWSDAGKELMDFGPGDDANTAQGWLNRMHPDDREPIREKIRQTINNKTNFNADYRVVLRTGKIRYINATGNVMFNEEGYAVSSTGLIQDITERKEAEATLAFLTNVNNDLIESSNIDSMLTCVGSKLAAFLNLSYCVFVKVDEANNKAEVIYNWHLPHLPSLAGSHKLEEFVTVRFHKFARKEKVFVVNDVKKDKRVDARTYDHTQIRSLVSVPLIRDRQWQFFISVCHSQPHIWQEREVNVVKQIASHLWTSLERKQGEDRLRQSEERYRSVLNSIDESYSLCEIILDENGTAVDYRRLQVNPAFLKLTGYSEEEALSKSAKQLLPLIEEEWIISYAKAATEATPVRFEGYVSALNKWFDVYVAPIVDHQTGKFAVIAKDITEKKWAELSLKQSEERLRLSIDAGNLGTCDYNTRSRTMLCNSMRYKMFGMQPAETPTNIDEFAKRVHPEDFDYINKTIPAQLRKEGRYTIEYRVQHEDGSIRWISEIGEAVEWDKKEPLRVISVLVDITDRKTEEQQKDDFFGVASHELKTPVTSIKAYTEILETIFRENGDAHATDLMGRLNSQVDRLTGLIRHMLDTTRISGGRMQLSFNTVDINSLLKNCIEEIQHTTDRHQLLLQTSPLPLISGDKDRLVQVIMNLLSNAIKYSPGSENIIIKSCLKNGEINIAITDYGIGMSNGTLARLFQRFFRSDNPAAHTYPGLGLGLYISREIMREHGGDINVKSEKGKGSEFTIRIPVQQNTTA